MKISNGVNLIKLQFGAVSEKSIITPNQFVSHMIEHIAWRLGVSVEVLWQDQDWEGLGFELGKQIKKFTPKQSQGVALGMIDDGSAEVMVSLSKVLKSPKEIARSASDEAILKQKEDCRAFGSTRARNFTLFPKFGNADSKEELKLCSAKNINLQWFLSSRCEQLNSGQPLVELLQGLSEGLAAKIGVRVCSFEDPHHTWEGVFRGVGMALNKIFTPEAKRDATSFKQEKVIKRSSSEDGNLVVRKSGINSAVVYRKTAETLISIGARFGNKNTNQFSINVDKSINIKGLDKLISLITKKAGFNLKIDFRARVLSSSHVVWEDIGLVLGRTLLEVLKARMETIGVNGAGSNLKRPADLKNLAVKVGLSVEGRKFLKIFPAISDYQQVRKELLLGKNIFGNLRSEDLDDFLDGFCGGMGCSLIVIVDRVLKPEDFWKSVFAGVGEAIKESFLPNPYRKGLPPGVKANLS